MALVSHKSMFRFSFDGQIARESANFHSSWSPLLQGPLFRKSSFAIWVSNFLVRRGPFRNREKPNSIELTARRLCHAGVRILLQSLCQVMYKWFNHNPSLHAPSLSVSRQSGVRGSALFQWCELPSFRLVWHYLQRHHGLVWRSMRSLSWERRS